jgi:coenzyme F420-reducing hydrogenase delta subunit/Pyruvate/2-oxoacid:ferredoxin oxidoreductase delta subunit
MPLCNNVKKMSRVIALIDRWANSLFTSKYNPFYHLGQLSAFLLVTLLVTGVYILLFYKINVERAYEAVEYLTVDQWYLGGIIRSIHRYASDALIITLILHGLRLLFTGKFTHNRWLIWVSGSVLLGFILLEGITGYWMVWDERSQLVATTTAEFLDNLPVFPKPLARAFISEESVTNLLFFAVIFVHVGGPMFLMALILIHFSRFTRTLLFPPKKMIGTVLLIMLALALVKPAVSAPPADLSKALIDVPVDWFYMFLLPLMHSSYGLLSWILVFIAFGAILAPPWIKRRRLETAKVVEDHCVGCELCYVDCPYGAISMSRDAGKSVAWISDGRCSGCGTCLGSCNFNAIKIGEKNLEKMKGDISRLLKPKGYTPLILGFVCEHAQKVDDLTEGRGGLGDLQGIRILPLRCLGMINPTIITHAFDEGADGVFLVGCKIGDCYYRLGNRWLRERLSGSRAPVLKDKRKNKIGTCWASPAEKDEVIEAFRKFKEELMTKKRRETPSPPKKRRIMKTALPLSLLVLFLPALLIWHFSDSPGFSVIDRDESLLLFTMIDKGERLVPCTEPTIEELKAQNFTECQRERVPVRVELKVDGVKVLSKVYKPRGIRRDGPSYAYEKIIVAPGIHRVSIQIRDSRKVRYNHAFNEKVMFHAGKVVIIDFEDQRFTLG